MTVSISTNYMSRFLPYSVEGLHKPICLAKVSDIDLLPYYVEGCSHKVAIKCFNRRSMSEFMV